MFSLTSHDCPPLFKGLNMKSASFVVATMSIAGLVGMGSCARSVDVAPATAAPAAVAQPVVADIATDEVTALMRYLEKLFMVQEVHYSHPQHGYKYASDTARLYRYQPEPGFAFTIFEGTQKGWAGMVRDEAGNACVVFIGAVARVPETPRGVRPDKAKRIVCDKPR